MLDSPAGELVVCPSASWYAAIAVHARKQDVSEGAKHKNVEREQHHDVDDLRESGSHVCSDLAHGPQPLNQEHWPEYAHDVRKRRDR